jgi:hypothetical protein
LEVRLTALFVERPFRKKRERCLSMMVRVVFVRPVLTNGHLKDLNVPFAIRWFMEPRLWDFSLKKMIWDIMIAVAGREFDNQ